MKASRSIELYSKLNKESKDISSKYIKITEMLGDIDKNKSILPNDYALEYYVKDLTNIEYVKTQKIVIKDVLDSIYADFVKVQRNFFNIILVHIYHTISSIHSSYINSKLTEINHFIDNAKSDYSYKFIETGKIINLIKMSRIDAVDTVKSNKDNVKKITELENTLKDAKKTILSFKSEEKKYMSEIQSINDKYLELNNKYSKIKENNNNKTQSKSKKESQKNIEKNTTTEINIKDLELNKNLVNENEKLTKIIKDLEISFIKKSQEFDDINKQISNFEDENCKLKNEIILNQDILERENLEILYLSKKINDDKQKYSIDIVKMTKK